MDTGLKAIHPITNEQLPVWVANFVLMAYGTGAVMAVLATTSVIKNLRINTVYPSVK